MSSKSFLKKMKEILLNEKLLLTSPNEDVMDSVDLDGDETDEIQGKMLINLQNALNQRKLIKLAAVDDALLRIEDNSYGVCEDCGEDIPEKRLIINPYFKVCVSCAEDQEFEEKQKRRI